MLALFHHIQAVMGMLCRFFHPGQPLGHLLPFGFRIRQLPAQFDDTVPKAPPRKGPRLMPHHRRGQRKNPQPIGINSSTPIRQNLQVIKHLLHWSSPCLRWSMRY